MTTTLNGRNVKVEVALTFATAATFTAITKAFPGVATKTGHGITNGTVGYWSAPSGMVQLDLQATAIANVAANTVELAGLDTTDYDTAAAGTDFIAGATWGLIEEAKGFAVGGGASDQLDDSRLHLNKRSNVAGLNAAEDLRISVAPPEVETAALQFCMRNARRGINTLFKITSLKTGKILRVAYGVPSVYDENLDVGALGTGGFSVTVPNYVLKPNG